MLELLDDGEVGSGKMLASVKNVCGLINDFVDYISLEYPEYIKDYWEAKNSNEFRDNLESKDHKIQGLMINGEFFGLIRDIANVSKHSKIRRDGAHVRNVDKIRESFAMIQYRDTDGVYCGVMPTVVVDHENGSRIPIELYLYLSFISFTSMLIQIEVIPNMPAIPRERRSFYKSRKEADQQSNAKFKFTVLENVNVVLSSYIYIGHPLLAIRGVKLDDKFECSIVTDIQIKKGVF